MSRSVSFRLTPWSRRPARTGIRKFAPSFDDPTPDLGFRSERSARTEILFCAPRLTAGRPPKLHSPFTRPSLTPHSPFTQKPRKWLTWTNAPLVRSARGAGGARSESGNPRISGEPGRRSGPPPVECAQSGLQEGRRAASRLSPLKLLAKRRRGRPWRSLRPFPLAPSLLLAVSPSASNFLKRSPSFPFLFARLALTLGRAKAIPPRPERRTKLRPAL